MERVQPQSKDLKKPVLLALAAGMTFAAFQEKADAHTVSDYRYDCDSVTFDFKDFPNTQLGDDTNKITVLVSRNDGEVRERTSSFTGSSGSVRVDFLSLGINTREDDGREGSTLRFGVFWEKDGGGSEGIYVDGNGNKIPTIKVSTDECEPVKETTTTTTPPETTTTTTPPETTTTTTPLKTDTPHETLPVTGANILDDDSKIIASAGGTLVIAGLVLEGLTRRKRKVS